MEITISGLCGSGKTTITVALARQLRLKTMSVGMFVREKAREANCSVEEFVQRIGSESIDEMTDLRTKEYGKTNTDFVCEGRLTWRFIPDAYKVLLICSLKHRAERRAMQIGIPVCKALKYLEARDVADAKRFREIYQIENISDFCHFDLVLDTTEITVEDTVYRICRAIRKHGATKADMQKQT